MNRPTVILNAILGLAVVGLYILYFSSGNKNQESVSNKETDKNKKEEIARKKKKEAENKKVREEKKVEIVYVNTDTIMAKYDYAVKIKNELESEGKSIETRFANRERALQNEALSFQQKVQQGQITSEAQYKSEGEVLAKKEQQFIKDRQTATNSFLKKENDANKKLYDKVYNFLEEYCAENGYKMVLSYSKLGGSILYGSEYLDVTDDVLEKLNSKEK